MLIQSPAKSMTDINERLCNNNPGDLFVTLWLGLLDCETGHLTYINAGHNPPILQRAGGETVYLEEQGDGQFMLAGMPYFEYEESELTLEPGDSIYLYTDGVTEAKNVDDEFFGEDRLIKLIDGLREYTPREIVETILTCGFYMTMARLTETTRTDIDPPAGTRVVDALKRQEARA